MKRSLVSPFLAALLLCATGSGCAHRQQTESKADILHGPRTASTARGSDAATATSSTSPGQSDGEGLPGSVYFGFDDATLLGGALADVEKVGRKMQQSPSLTVRIEGHCDERGTTEYNMALGNQRAEAASRYLQRLGVAKSRIHVVSYGSERPRNPGHDESAWQDNRRDDLIIR